MRNYGMVFMQAGPSQGGSNGRKKLVSGSKTLRGKENNDAEEIDQIIMGLKDWRGKTLGSLRSIILESNPEIKEQIKWRKPSRPQGVPVWYVNGIICVADILKNAVRLTFPKGAKIYGGEKLFNTRLESLTVRAVDFREGQMISREILTSVVNQAISLNTEKVTRKG